MAFESHRLRGENYIRSSENVDREHPHYITPGSYHHYPESRRELRPPQPEPRFIQGEHGDDEQQASYGRRGYHRPPHAYPPHVDHSYQRHRKEMSSYYGTHPPMLGLPQSQRHNPSQHQEKLPARAILPHPRLGYPQEPFDDRGGRHYPRRPSPPEMHKFRPRPREHPQDHLDDTQTAAASFPPEKAGFTSSGSSRSVNSANTPVTTSSTLQDDATSLQERSRLRANSHNVHFDEEKDGPKTTPKESGGFKGDDMLSDALLLASVASMARSEVKKISPSSSSEAELEVNEESVNEEEKDNSPSSEIGGEPNTNRLRNRTPSPQEFQNTTTVTPSTMPSSVKVVKSFQDLDSNKPLLQPKLSSDDCSDEGESSRRGPIQITSSRDHGDYHSVGTSPSTQTPPYLDGMVRGRPEVGPPMLDAGPKQRQHSLVPRKTNADPYHDNDEDRERVPVMYPVHRKPNQPHPQRLNDRGAPVPSGEGYFQRYPRPHHLIDREQYMRKRPLYEEDRMYHHHPRAEPPMYHYPHPPHYPRGGGEPGNFHPLPPYEGRRHMPRDMHLRHPIDLRDRHIPMPRMIGAHHEDHGAYHYAHPPPHSHVGATKNNRGKTILRRKCAWKNYPELEKFLIDNREEYLRHSAMNYTAEQKQFNNDLTKKLLEVADKYDYEFDPEDFNFVAIRDRIRCYYKSYVQNCKKRGIAVGYDTKGNKRQKVSPSSDGSCDSSDTKTPQTCDETKETVTEDDNSSSKQFVKDEEKSPLSSPEAKQEEKA